MKTFPRIQSYSLSAKLLVLIALLVAGIVAANPAMADRKRTTTVIRTTVHHTPVYHSPVYHAPVYHTSVYHSPSVIIPVSNPVYVGSGSGYINTRHRHTTVYREVSRHDRHYRNDHDRGVRHPVRGRWSGASRHRDVIYVDRNARKGSRYREAERRSVMIRERSR